MACPEDQILGSYLSRTLPEPLRDEVEDHVSRCDLCFEAFSRTTAALQGGGLAEGERVRIRRTPAARWKAAAIAASALAAAGAGWLVFAPSRPRPPQRQQDRLVEGAFAWQSGPGQSETVQLPDGTVLKVGERTEARLEVSAPGERARLRLERGELELWVAKGSGAFRIAAPGGETRVLGTHFKIRALTFPAARAVCAEVYEGKIELLEGSGAVQIQGGQRGIALKGQGVYAQELGRGWEPVWADLARIVRLDESGVRIPLGREPDVDLLAATFWGAWWGESWDWRELLRRDDSPEKKAAAILLVSLASPPGAREALAGELARAVDPRLRKGIQDALDRVKDE